MIHLFMPQHCTHCRQHSVTTITLKYHRSYINSTNSLIQPCVNSTPNGEAIPANNPHKRHMFTTRSVTIVPFNFIRQSFTSNSLTGDFTACFPRRKFLIDFTPFRGLDSHIVHRPIKARLHEPSPTIRSVPPRVHKRTNYTHLYATLFRVCCVQPGRGRRFRVYRACDFRRTGKRWIVLVRLDPREPRESPFWTNEAAINLFTYWSIATSGNLVSRIDVYPVGCYAQLPSRTLPLSCRVVTGQRCILALT